MNYGTYGTPGTILRRLINAFGGISENELARQTDVNQPTINRILRDQSKEPKSRNLNPLAKFFGITLAQMRGEEPIPDEVFERLSREADKQRLASVQEDSELYTIQVSHRAKKVVEGFEHLSEEDQRKIQREIDEIASKQRLRNEEGLNHDPPATKTG